MKREMFVNIHISVKTEVFEIFYGMLYNYKFVGVEEQFDKLIVCFKLDEWERIKEHFYESMKLVSDIAQIEKEEKMHEKNWNEEWEKNLKPFVISERIGISPSVHLDKLNTEIKLIINPKMSFGTGEHATTRLSCALLEKVLKPNTNWVDVGTGTGVLAILAAKLGAAKILAFDNNYWSIDNAVENVQLNRVENLIDVFEADIETYNFPECDGITANLFSSLLLPSIPKFYEALKNNKGDLILSGILKYDVEDIKSKAKETGFVLKQEIYDEEWAGLHFVIE